MAKRKDVIATAMAGLYGTDDRARARRYVRKICDELESRPNAEQAMLLSRIVEIVARRFVATESVDLDEDRHSLLGASLADHYLARGDVRFIVRQFLTTNQEEWGADSQGDPVTAIAWMKIRAKFFVYVGATPETTLRFCRLLFEFIARWEERYVPQERMINIHEHPDHWTYGSIQVFFLESVTGPTGENMPLKDWLIRLIEAAAKRHREAESYLGAIITIHNSVAEGGVGSRIFTQNEMVQLFWRQGVPLESGFFQPNLRSPAFVIPDHLQKKVARIIERNRKQREKMERDCVAFQRWYEQDGPAIQRALERMGREVQASFRTWVLANGQDSCLIRISALWRIGIRSFSFYPEGETLPNVKLKIAQQKTSPVLCECWAALREFELIARDHIFENWENTEIGYLRDVLRIVVIDALHRIAVRRPTRNLANQLVDRSEIGREFVPSHRVPVRWYRRNLPDGFAASDDALERAYLTTGVLLPPGVTFVKEHERWAGLPAGKPAPLFRYTDAMLRKSVALYSEPPSP